MSRIDQALRRAASEGRSDLPAVRGTGFYPGIEAPRVFPPHPDDEEVLEIRRVVAGLLRRRRQILLVALAVIVPVAVATALAERLYRASAMVQIDPEPVEVLPYREIDMPSLTPTFELFMKSEEQILRGAALVERVRARLEADRGPDAAALKQEVSGLGSRLWLQRIENTQIFRLGYLAPRPDVAAKVANLYAEEYLKLHFDARQQTREKAKRQLEAELQSLEANVRNSDKELVAYAQEHGIPATENAGSLIQEKLATLAKQLTDTEAEAFAASARLNALKSASVERFPDKLMTTVIQGLVTRLTSLEHEKTALRATFGPNWSTVVQKDGEIALVREQLTREKASALDQARQQALLDVSAVENKRKLIAASADQQQQLAHKLETASIQYHMIKGEAEKNRLLYDGVLEQLKKTSLTSGMEFGGFRVVERALPPSSVDSPRPLWNLSLATLLGLALGLTVALARNYWDTSVATVEDVEHLDLLPVLGTVPLARLKASESGGVLAKVRAQLPATTEAPGSVLARRDATAAPDPAAAALDLPGNPVLAEDLRTICASLLLSRSDRPPRVLLVTSATPAEGKTTVASALAKTLADSGPATLLVDCDVRRGRLDKVFDITSDGGLTLFLAGHVGGSPTIHPTSTPNLSVVTAGPAAPNPPALLGSERMKEFLAAASDRHQFIVLDAPPVIPLADARVLARLAEGVILVVRAGRVSKSMVRRACSLIESAGGSVLGAVLNGADDRASESHYHYNYYYRPDQN